MPELPEVETVAAILRPHLLQRRLDSWIARRPRLREPLSQDGIPLPGQKILSLVRRGKYLLITFTNAAVLLLHLGMTGSLAISPATDPPETHEHLVLVFDNGTSLRLSDPRRFGLARVIPPGSRELDIFLSELGPEPLSRQFTADVLAKSLERKTGPIKQLLLDQSIVAGIGNIYASEALFLSRIHPLRPGDSLSGDDLQALVGAIKQTLKKAIDAGAAEYSRNRPSLSHPVTGEETHFSQELFAYDREGETCLTCHRGKIRRVILGGRSTFFCPVCQKARKSGRVPNGA